MQRYLADKTIHNQNLQPPSSKMKLPRTGSPFRRTKDKLTIEDLCGRGACPCTRPPYFNLI
ncbi:hypothetical protein HanIR_Chr14g0723731 [Helianthus annuus]|nr:hypothetical protein HanIR_Chr14g0723731 [Helianthus annuus]